jgi:hypothetical protein
VSRKHLLTARSSQAGWQCLAVLGGSLMTSSNVLPHPSYGPPPMERKQLQSQAIVLFCFVMVWTWVRQEFGEAVLGGVGVLPWRLHRATSGLPCMAATALQTVDWQSGVRKEVLSPAQSWAHLSAATWKVSVWQCWEGKLS